MLDKKNTDKYDVDACQIKYSKIVFPSEVFVRQRIVVLLDWKSSVHRYIGLLHSSEDVKKKLSVFISCFSI